MLEPRQGCEGHNEKSRLQLLHFLDYRGLVQLHQVIDVIQSSQASQEYQHERLGVFPQPHHPPSGRREYEIGSDLTGVAGFKPAHGCLPPRQF
jgi:hypothetical protein